VLIWEPASGWRVRRRFVRKPSVPCVTARTRSAAQRWLTRWPNVGPLSVTTLNVL
jgi:hypothetical protein